MVNRKKKKGSSILITVGMFAMLSILIMSVLAMTTSGYSLRIKNNKRIENFYAADSGLEISQKVLHDYLGKVVKASLNKVDEYVQSKPDGKLSQSEKEEKFQEFFKDIILNGGTLKDDTGNVIEQLKTVKDEVELPSNYDSFKRDGKNIEIQSEIKSLKKDGTEIVIPTIPYKDIYKFSLNVKSNFTDKDNKDREVEVDFDILIPEYGKLLVRVKNSKAPNILDYIVGVDGNYTLTVNGSTSVLGDIWVKGKTNSDIIDLSDKYSGGITLSSSGDSASSINWNGKIATNETLRIKDVSLAVEAEKNKERNVFARNVHISNNKTKSSKEVFGESVNLHVYNDFVMEGKENNVVLNNYYGLNDINDYEANWTNKNLSNAQKSSAMLINALDFSSGSSIYIMNNLFILGTSYLDLKGNDYQTGQSTIMNNISRPYTMRYDDYIYEYKSYDNGGIQIATKDKNGNKIPLNSDEKNKNSKVDLAKKFYESSENLKSGITVPDKKIVSPGVVLANGEAVVNTPTGEQLELIKEKQSLFVAEVFNMGSDKKYGQKDFWNNEVKESVKDSFKWSEISTIANKNYSSDSKIQYIDGNKEDFVHLASKNTIKEIYDEAKKVNNEFGDYESIISLIPNEHANLILSNSDKEIIIRSTGKAQQIEKNEQTRISEVEIETETGLKKQIIYDIDIGGDTQGNATPLLIIAKGNVTLEVKENSFNYVMVISASDSEIKGNPSHIGNFSAGKGTTTTGNERNMINEMFKYILESSEFLGSIGGDIFEGNEDIITTNAIEISHLIKSKNWKLNK